MNFASDLLRDRPPEGLALVELARDGTRREWTFGEVAAESALMASALRARGVGRGDVVMTLIGNRPEWVLAMMACFRIGAVVLPCTEQLRAKDLELRLEVARPELIVADERNADELEASRPRCEVLWVGASKKGCPARARAHARGAPPTDIHIPPLPTDLEEGDPALITFTSGTAGEPKAVVHGQRYLYGQRNQAEHWLGAEKGDLVWCTAASGWSKSARNAWIAPWLMGATALLHDARFDPRERLDLIEREQVNILCMAPTEYRVIAKRAQLRPLPSLKGMVAAGEALNPEVLKVWRDATGLDIRDGYGQTETGQMTGMWIGIAARAGSMGRALPGVRLSVRDGELVADPGSVGTFFLGYLGEGVVRCRGTDGEGRASWRIDDRREDGEWRTGDQVEEDADGYLHFEGRADDVIVSAGYRIGPFEVESALVSHAAVAEAAAVAAPDDERGSVVRAIVVLRDGIEPSDALKSELQDHVKAETAPYKYPRIVDFAAELPKTASGKVQRALLRARLD